MKNNDLKKYMISSLQWGSFAVLTKQHQQEALSLAYVHAVSGHAGVNLSINRRHDYGIDGTFQHIANVGGRRVESGFVVNFQLKSTTDWTTDNSDIVYDVEAQTYNDIVGREEGATVCLLIVLCLPANEPPVWLEHSEEQLILRHCCYWTYLKGDLTRNTSKKRIRIPRANKLTTDSLHDILLAERTRNVGGEANGR